MLKKPLLILVLLLTLPLMVACQGNVKSGSTPASPSSSKAVTLTPTSTPIPLTATPTASPTPAPINHEGAPAWFHHATMYEIFVRSFADSDGDGIGDLNGITQHLNYIQSLGVNVIWLMPIYPSPSEHGYDVSNFFGINPDYGTMSDLQRLIKAAHSRGMRLVLDFVPSHLSRENPIFQDALGNPNSRYSNWFVWTNKAHTTYATFAGNEAMPRFNHYNPEVVKYLCRAAQFWLDPNNDGDPSDGVDGFRVDNATFPPPSFLVALHSAVKQTNPHALLLGEAWVYSPFDLGQFSPREFDALFDFPFYETMMGSPTTDNDGVLGSGDMPAAIVQNLWKEEKRWVSPKITLVRFLGNHDTNRLATELGDSKAREKLAAALLAALPGTAMIYYGDEIGMRGRKGGPPFWDDYRRAPMEWYAADAGAAQPSWFSPPDSPDVPYDGVSVEEEKKNPDSLLNFYRRAFRLRKTLPALQTDTFSWLSLSSNNAEEVLAFTRGKGTATLVVLANLGKKTATIKVRPPIDAAKWQDILNNSRLIVLPNADLQLTLPPYSIIWAVPER